jgi:putative nucleotidyltransferase with HDIG domain
MASFFGHCLVVERDIFFLDKLQEKTSSNEEVFLISKTFKDAANLLKKPQNRVRAIFISLSFGSPEVTAYIKQQREQGFDGPCILLVHQQRLTLSAEELAVTGASEQIVTPVGEESLLKVLKKLFPERHNWQKIQASAEAKGEQLELKDEDFMPIVTEAFLLTEKCFFNVFIRLGENKFVKILNAGDPFDADFAEKYNSSKVATLWVSKSEHHQYTHLSEKNVASGLQRHSGDVEKRISHLGDNVAKALSRAGITEDNLLYADRFLGHTVDYLRQQRMKHSGYSAILEELATAEHPAAVAVIAGLIAQQLGFESTKAIKLIGLAALLHDVGIYHERPDFPAENPELLTGPDLQLYERHAREGAEFLQKMNIFDEAVIQAVAMHHSKHSIHAGHATTLVSEIVAASDMFCHRVLGVEEPNMTVFFGRNLKAFRPQIEEAFRAVLKKKSQKSA